jgi:hypothetical protein
VATADEAGSGTGQALASDEAAGALECPDPSRFDEWGFVRPREYFSGAAAAARAAFRR